MLLGIMGFLYHGFNKVPLESAIEILNEIGTPLENDD